MRAAGVTRPAFTSSISEPAHRYFGPCAKGCRLDEGGLAFAQRIIARAIAGRVNLLAAARIFLFGARDVWFVVGLPVFLYASGWKFLEVGTFLAVWTID